MAVKATLKGVRTGSWSISLGQAQNLRSRPGTMVATAATRAASLPAHGSTGSSCWT